MYRVQGGRLVILMVGECNSLFLVVSIFSLKEEAKRESGEEIVRCLTRKEEL